VAFFIQKPTLSSTYIYAATRIVVKRFTRNFTQNKQVRTHAAAIEQHNTGPNSQYLSRAFAKQFFVKTVLLLQQLSLRLTS
jgi:hypothetical protein